MSAFIIALTVNVILVIALLYVIFRPRVVSYITQKKQQREKQKKQYIETIVINYLKQLQKDGE
jgi:hypothetical protein